MRPTTSASPCPPRASCGSTAGDDDGQLQFVGENEIDHTPRNETVRVTTGNSFFDLVGERKQTAFRVDTSEKWLDESFSKIKLRNRKKEPVEIRVVEHLYRWSNVRDITAKSDDYTKKDAQTIECCARIPRETRRRTHRHLQRALFVVSRFMETGWR